MTSQLGDLSSFFSNDIYVWLVLTFSSLLSDEMEESLEEKVRGGQCIKELFTNGVMTKKHQVTSII